MRMNLFRNTTEGLGRPSHKSPMRRWLVLPALASLTMGAMLPAMAVAAPLAKGDVVKLEALSEHPDNLVFSYESWPDGSLHWAPEHTPYTRDYTTYRGVNHIQMNLVPAYPGIKTITCRITINNKVIDQKTVKADGGNLMQPFAQCAAHKANGVWVKSVTHQVPPLASLTIS